MMEVRVSVDAHEPPGGEQGTVSFYCLEQDRKRNGLKQQDTFRAPPPELSSNMS